MHNPRLVMEDNVKRCRFCFIVNTVNKIIDAIKSRCLCLRFAPIEPDAMKKKLLYISKKEGLPVDEAYLDLIISTSHGDMRQSIFKLQYGIAPEIDRRFHTVIDTTQDAHQGANLQLNAMLEYHDASGGSLEMMEQFQEFLKLPITTPHS